MLRLLSLLSVHVLASSNSPRRPLTDNYQLASRIVIVDTVQPYCMRGRIRFILRGAFFPHYYRTFLPLVLFVSIHKWLLLFVVLDYSSRRHRAFPTHFIMAAINKAIDRPKIHDIIHDLAKRRNWASKNPGVILVFCIVFIVAMGLVLLFLYRRIIRKRAEKEAYTG